jgi:hypothetical protein
MVLLRKPSPQLPPPQLTSQQRDHWLRQRLPIQTCTGPMGVAVRRASRLADSQGLAPVALALVRLVALPLPCPDAAALQPAQISSS